MRHIKRAIEDVVLHLDKTFKCVLVTGARQTGKTETIKKLFSDRKYASLDDPFVEDLANNNPNMFLTLNQPPVVYDEVQLAPGLFGRIKTACDESGKSGLFCLAGSQPLELTEIASESLARRVGIVEIAPLSQREINADPFDEPFLPTLDYVLKRNASAKTPKNVCERIHRGGYPAMQDPSVDWGAFFSGYVKTYLERDVRRTTAVQNLNDFRRFMVAVAARTGQIVNYSAVANEIGKDQTTVKAWISILEATGVAFLLKPFVSKSLTRAIKAPKLYFRDTGLAAYLTRWLTPETLASGAMSGAFFETFAVSEILKSYSNRGLDYRNSVSYYRGRDKKRLRRNGKEVAIESEIDLIVEENGVLYPVEINRNATVDADQTSAFTILDRVDGRKRGSGAVVCDCPRPGALKDDVLQIPVWFI